MTQRTALVTGASGYVGAQLVPALLDAGWHVRVLARTPSKLQGDWRDLVEVAQGDATDPDDVRAALDGVQVAYYLLHSMDGQGDYRERDRRMAHTFAEAAVAQGVGRLVYLSGLHPEGPLSTHLASRVEVGDILLASGVPTAVLQAGVVLGDGSASFDMLRHLTERLPVAIGPKWLRNRIQPIAIDDVVHYLVRAAELDPQVNRTIDIGMDEILTYRDMMRRYARATGLLPRIIGTVPVLTPWLASHWVGVVTPVDSGIAKPLVGSLIHEAVKSEDDAATLLGDPPGGVLGFDAAVRRATDGVDPHRWSRTLFKVGAGVAATAVAGSLLTAPDSAWYRRLRKPVFQPPPVAFPVVWTALYALITVAGTATIADLHEDDRADEAQGFGRALAANLVLNAAWSGLFFRAKNPPLATAGAAVLAASSADLSRRAASAGEGKAAAFGAYAAWCTFATLLSAAVARLNPSSRSPRLPK
ncbi:tryptophan-rich sensory protein [Tessaracoccus flavus]|uniref:DNA-binding protein n=1 Tax=Tessaracoccus flavus TaxID=1610493 RepID=A0A1Q2CGV8_9ACTN|nr:tryptophan-rich sensory protein [Tessaracoccus flavus]AQP45337.1 DNA-binding protein [Tessaracoccus flavus]SDY48316.1 TspO and MBR related proteins [Tessaracoccus flavus]